jgi:hydroxymethylpyrimidine/phosphomethylpyrimidine kinase
VVKGGHAVSDTPGEAVDVVWHAGRLREIRAQRIATPNNHGSGCSFASAVAASLARGLPVDDAVDAAKDFVWRGVSTGAGWHLGAGHGPLNHFNWA